MREILFRGKRVDNGQDVTGYYWCNECGNHFIRTSAIGFDYNICDYEVIRETVRQYTGLEDRNGKKIYNGDIVKLDGYKKKSATIGDYEKYNQTAVFRLDEHPIWELNGLNRDTMVVIGNIHDNPELLEVVEE